MKDLDLQLNGRKIKTNGEDESMWTTIGTDILVYVIDPDGFGVKALALLLFLMKHLLYRLFDGI